MGTRMKKSKAKKIVALSVVGGIFLLIAILALVALFFYNGLKSDFEGDPNQTQTAVVEVESGDTTTVIAEKLAEQGIITHATLFRLYASFIRNLDTKLQVGTYEFSYGDSWESILQDLSKAPNFRPSVTITFPEGCEVSDMIELFLANGIGTKAGFEAAMDHDYGYLYLPAVGTANRLEGFLYPDTYQFFVDSTEVEVFTKMISNFNQKAIDSGLEAKAAAADMTVYDAIILGSIIQKESGNVADFAMISSVFNNRLDIDMLLQSDAAVSYAIPKAERRPSCTYEQLTTDTPYNTYMHKGLTVTPICCPRMDAIVAACQPAESEYYYFIGYVDSSGVQHTVFAKTLKEHEANISKYLK